MTMCTYILLGGVCPQLPALVPNSSAVESINNTLSVHQHYWKTLKPFRGEWNLNYDYCKYSEIETTLRIWATIIILQNNQWEIWATLDLSPVAIAQNTDLAVNLADRASRYFQKIWATLNP